MRWSLIWTPPQPVLMSPTQPQPQLVLSQPLWRQLEPELREQLLELREQLRERREQLQEQLVQLMRWQQAQEERR